MGISFQKRDMGSEMMWAGAENSWEKSFDWDEHPNRTPAILVWIAGTGFDQYLFVQFSLWVVSFFGFPYCNNDDDDDDDDDDGGGDDDNSKLLSSQSWNDQTGKRGFIGTVRQVGYVEDVEDRGFAIQRWSRIQHGLWAEHAPQWSGKLWTFTAWPFASLVAVSPSPPGLSAFPLLV